MDPGPVPERRGCPAAGVQALVQAANGPTEDLSFRESLLHLSVELAGVDAGLLGQRHHESLREQALRSSIEDVTELVVGLVRMPRPALEPVVTAFLPEDLFDRLTEGDLLPIRGDDR